jgi:hypothetical protein
LDDDHTLLQILIGEAQRAIGLPFWEGGSGLWDDDGWFVVNLEDIAQTVCVICAIHMLIRRYEWEGESYGEKYIVAGAISLTLTPLFNHMANIPSCYPEALH